MNVGRRRLEVNENGEDQGRVCHLHQGGGLIRLKTDSMNPNGAVNIHCNCNCKVCSA
jgi:hypothetical protein